MVLTGQVNSTVDRVVLLATWVVSAVDWVVLLVGRVSLFNLKWIGLGQQQWGIGGSGNNKER